MSRIAVLFSIVALGPLAPTLASADSKAWQDSFEPSTLAAYHKGGSVTGVIVLAAGEPGKDLSDAAAALRQAYTRSGVADLIMDDEALGSVSGLSDAQIVKRAKHLPVSHVAVVRVFGSARSRTAVVTVYDKWGAVYTSFAVKAGQKLAQPGAERPAAPISSDPPPIPPGPTDLDDRPVPIDPDPGDPVGPSSITQDDPFGPEVPGFDTGPQDGDLPPESDEDALARYDREFIYFDNADIKKGKLVEWDRNSRAFQGDKKKKILEGADFYEAAGRKDLAAKYRVRSYTRWSLILGGIAVAVGGVTYPVLLAEDCSGFPMAERDDCEGRGTRRSLVGAGIFGAGLVTWAIGWFAINPHPVTAAEAKTIVDQHNVKLRERLDVPVGDGIEPLSRARRPAVDVSPFVGPSGGGLVLSGRF